MHRSGFGFLRLTCSAAFLFRVSMFTVRLVMFAMGLTVIAMGFTVIATSLSFCLACSAASLLLRFGSLLSSGSLGTFGFLFLTLVTTSLLRSSGLGALSLFRGGSLGTFTLLRSSSLGTIRFLRLAGPATFLLRISMLGVPAIVTLCVVAVGLGMFAMFTVGFGMFSVLAMGLGVFAVFSHNLRLTRTAALLLFCLHNARSKKRQHR